MREGPERVPPHQTLAGAFVIGKIVLVLLVSTALGRAFTLLAVTSSVVWAAALGCCVLYGLFLANKLHRFAATFSAILGIDVVLSSVFGVALIIQQSLGLDVAQSMSVIFMLWHMLIIGFIMHRALNINLGLGIGAGLVISIFSTTVTAVATL